MQLCGIIAVAIRYSIKRKQREEAKKLKDLRSWVLRDYARKSEAVTKMLAADPSNHKLIPAIKELVFLSYLVGDNNKAKHLEGLLEGMSSNAKNENSGNTTEMPI